MTAEFDPSQYKDEYREALETIIEAKIDGRETVAIEEPEESGNLIDLMAALEKSVADAKAKRAAGSEEPVSVADAREAKEAKAAAAGAKSKRPARAKAADAEAEARRRGRRAEAERAAKPARKRKSA